MVDDLAATTTVRTQRSSSSWRGDAAVYWMVGFAAIHAAGAVAAALDIGPYTGLGAVLVNVFYIVLPLVGALLTDAIVHPGRRRLPARVVDLGAAVGVVLLPLVGALGMVHQIGWLIGSSEQNVAEAAFELYVIAGALLYTPIATAHLRTPRSQRTRRQPTGPRPARPASRAITVTALVLPRARAHGDAAARLSSHADRHRPRVARRAVHMSGTADVGSADRRRQGARPE
jgi:hypothetical protein